MCAFVQAYHRLESQTAKWKFFAVYYVGYMAYSFVDLIRRLLRLSYRTQNVLPSFTAKLWKLTGKFVIPRRS